jgi:hypothetical protein
VAVQDVEERRVAGADEPVAVHVGVRRAPLAGDRVDPLDVLAAQVVQDLAHQAHALVLADAGTEELVQLLVRRVDHRARLREQADLVAGLDAAGLQEDLLAVHDGEPFGLQRRQDRHLDDVDAERRVGHTVLAQHGGDLLGHVGGDARVRVERAAQRGDPGPGPLGAVEPGVVELVVPGGGAEVPHHRLAPARKHGEPDQLVHRPGADVRRGQIADVGEVEREQRAELRRVQLGLEPVEPLMAQPIQVDALFPVDGVRPERADSHRVLLTEATPPVKGVLRARVKRHLTFAWTIRTLRARTRRRRRA